MLTLLDGDAALALRGPGDLVAVGGRDRDGQGDDETRHQHFPGLGFSSNESLSQLVKKLL